MTAVSRLQPFDLLVFKRFERPLLVKADVHEIALGIVAGECLLYPRKRTFGKSSPVMREQLASVSPN